MSDPKTSEVTKAVLTVIGALSVGLIGFVVHNMYQEWSNPQPSVRIIEIPFETGAPFSFLTSGSRDEAVVYLSNMLSSRQDQNIITMDLAARTLQEQKGAIANAVSLLGRNPNAIAHVQIQNHSSKRIPNVVVRFPGATRILTKNDDGRTWKSFDGERSELAPLEPNETRSIIVFGRGIAFQNGVSVTVSNEAIKPDIISTLNAGTKIDAFFRLGVVFSIIFIIGVITTINTLFATIRSSVVSWRRDSMSESEFNVILGDVEALYGKFRPHAKNPFLPSDTASSPITSTTAFDTPKKEPLLAARRTT